MLAKNPNTVFIGFKALKKFTTDVPRLLTTLLDVPKALPAESTDLITTPA